MRDVPPLDVGDILPTSPHIAARAAIERFGVGVALLATLAATLFNGVNAVLGNAESQMLLPYTLALSAALGCALWMVVRLAKSGSEPRTALYTSIALIGVLAAMTVSLEAGTRDGNQLMLAMLLTAIWCASLVPWPLMLAIATACFAIPFASGASLVLTYQTAIPPGAINGPTYFVVCFLPVGIAASIQHGYRVMRDNHAHTLDLVERNVRTLEQTIEARTAAFANTQDQLFRAQKIRTTGTLAAGLAHELNNILTPARGFAELLVDHHTSDQAPHYARRILDATIASTGITRALLTYTKQTPFSPENTELRTFLRTQVTPMMSQIVPDHASLEVQCPRGIFVSVDRQMFQQTITNLVLNAVDATRERGAIRIAVETEHPSPDPDAAHIRSDASRSGRPTAGNAIIRVSDDGTGIPTDDLEQIFDPFYTTKAHGTGLGLPTVQGIVERHDGSISVDSSPEGTSVCIRLPMQALIVPPEGEVDSEDTSDQLHALVLSNDVDLLDEVEALLEEASLRVTTNARSRGADSIQWRPHRFDVVVQDVDGLVMGSDEFEGSLVPRILLTDRSKHDPEALRGLSGNHVYRLRKPVDHQHFRSVLNSALSSTLTASSDGPGRA